MRQFCVNATLPPQAHQLVLVSSGIGVHPLHLREKGLYMSRESSYGVSSHGNMSEMSARKQISVIGIL